MRFLSWSRSCSQWGSRMFPTHTRVFFTERSVFVMTRLTNFYGQHLLYIASAAWKPPNSSGPAWTGLWGVRRPSLDISFCWLAGWSLQRRGGRQRLTSCRSNDIISRDTVEVEQWLRFPSCPGTVRWGGGTVGGASGSGSVFLLL